MLKTPLASPYELQTIMSLSLKQSAPCKPKTLKDTKKCKITK